MTNCRQATLTLVVPIEQLTFISLATQLRAHFFTIVRELTVSARGAGRTQAVRLGRQALDHINTRAPILARMIRALLLPHTERNSGIAHTHAPLSLCVWTVQLRCSIFGRPLFEMHVTRIFDG